MSENGKVVDGQPEGSGSHREGLYKTYLGRWLTLFRVQSVPISSVVVSMGYLLATQEIIMREIYGLVAVAALGHAGINAQNDALDYYTDLENKGDDKPLMSGSITVKQAVFASSVLIITSVGLAYHLFVESFGLYVMSIIMASAYNVYSSDKWWSIIFFGLWGLFFSIFGYSVGGGGVLNNGFSLPLSFALMLSSYIFLGDILDADADEESVHKKLGAEVKELSEDVKVFVPSNKLDEVYVIIFFAVWSGFLIAENIVYSGFDSGPAVITALMSMAAYKAVKLSCHPNILNDTIKKDFLLYVILTSGAILVVYAPVMGVVYVMIMFIGSLLWAVVSMKILYGSWLYFP